MQKTDDAVLCRKLKFRCKSMHQYTGPRWIINPIANALHFSFCRSSYLKTTSTTKPQSRAERSAWFPPVKRDSSSTASPTGCTRVRRQLTVQHKHNTTKPRMRFGPVRFLDTGETIWTGALSRWHRKGCSSSYCHKTDNVKHCSIKVVNTFGHVSIKLTPPWGVCGGGGGCFH